MRNACRNAEWVHGELPERHATSSNACRDAVHGQLPGRVISPAHTSWASRSPRRSSTAGAGLPGAAAVHRAGGAARLSGRACMHVADVVSDGIYGRMGSWLQPGIASRRG